MDKQAIMTLANVLENIDPRDVPRVAFMIQSGMTRQLKYAPLHPRTRKLLTSSAGSFLASR